MQTYNDGPFAPAPIPVTRDETDPMAVAPNRSPDGNLRIELHAHLEVALERRLGDGERARVHCVGASLETANHGLEVALFGSFHRRRGRAVGRQLQDGVLRVVLLHRVQVVGALEQVLALAARVLCAHRLAVYALRRETLQRFDRWLLKAPEPLL